MKTFESSFVESFIMENPKSSPLMHAWSVKSSNQNRTKGHKKVVCLIKVKSAHIDIRVKENRN